MELKPRINSDGFPQHLNRGTLLRAPWFKIRARARRGFTLSLFILTFTLLALSCSKKNALKPEDELILHDNWIEIPGTIYPERFNTYGSRFNGHHFIVWRGGSNADKALINTEVSDKTILEALVKIGAEPGNNLTQETWTQRHNKTSKEPDKHVAGTKIDIYIKLANKWHKASALFKTKNEKNFDIRVGGHAALIPIWQSGCVTCLFSCPGGRTSNAAYTIRDQAYDRVEFLADTALLPEDGSEVTIKMALSASEHVHNARENAHEATDKEARDT